MPHLIRPPVKPAPYLELMPANGRLLLPVVWFLIIIECVLPLRANMYLDLLCHLASNVVNVMTAPISSTSVDGNSTAAPNPSVITSTTSSSSANVDIPPGGSINLNILIRLLHLDPSVSSNEGKNMLPLLRIQCPRMLLFLLMLINRFQLQLD